MTILVFILIAIRSVGGGGLAPCAHPAWPFGLFPPVAPVAGISRAINPLSQSPPLHCLIVGGGPDREDNEVAIESNVRYVRSLMPRNTKARVLYANGDRTAQSSSSTIRMVGDSLSHLRPGTHRWPCDRQSV